jgi:GT2 family glycosyltransferase
MTPKVTVLLAVHDGEPFVRRCVESVLGQSFADFEFLVIDDASTDATPSILASYDDPRLRVLRNYANQGQVPSLNRGLRDARGEYVARIDSDDWCRSERLARQIALLDENPQVGLVGTWMDVVDVRDRPVARLRSTIGDFAEFVFHTLIMRVLISHPSAMYRREAVLRGGGYDERTAPAEDKDLWRRLLLGRWDARIVPESLVVYRLHHAQLSQTQAANQRRVDGQSQERFLTALAADVPARGLRLLLANDEELWTEPQTPTAAHLDRLLTGAAERLRLNEAERAKLQELVAARVAAVARTHPWRASARTLAGAAIERLPAADRPRARAANVLAFVVAPVRGAARTGARELARAAERVPIARALSAPARRSRMARRLYGKLVGSS